MTIAAHPAILLRREEKAQKLAAVLREEHVSAEMAREVFDCAEFWAAAEHAAKTKPSSVTTRRLALDILERGI